MAQRLKSDEEILCTARELRSRRQSLHMTLIEVQNHLGVNCGQLSRFERGDFKTWSENLQKYANFLRTRAEIEQSQQPLGARIEKFAALSARHREVAEDLVGALEKIHANLPWL